MNQPCTEKWLFIGPLLVFQWGYLYFCPTAQRKKRNFKYFVMKKILEVLLCGDHDLRFNTDIDQAQLPDLIPQLTSAAAFTMLTKLWGGNETSVLAMIRALSIADLAVSANRKEMLRNLDICSGQLAQAIQEAREYARKKGATILTFGPGVMPPKMKS